MAKETRLDCISGFGTQRGPFVTITVNGENLVQMSVEEARHHAANLLQAAEAAEMDGIVIAWATDRVGVTMEEATKLLLDFRKLRDAARRRREGVV